jgi:hypothetical protein
VTGFTRLTVAGASRRAEVVVASGDPLGAALPSLLTLLDETGGTVARPVTLVAADGDQLDIARSPQQLDLVDGTLLRLVRLDTAPPPPVVIDAVDAAADAHDARVDRWDDRARATAGGTGIAAAFAAAGFLAPFGDAVVAMWALAGAVVVLLGAAVLLGLLGVRSVSGLVTVAAAGLALPLGVSASAAAAAAYSPASAALLGAAGAIAAGSLAVLLGIGAARRAAGAAAGGGLGLVLSALLVVLLLAGVDAAASAAIAGTVAAFATGPLPWVALSAAGLTELDERVGAGERVSPARALARIDDAYAALTWSLAGVCAVLAVSGVALVLDGELWSGLLALAFALAAALRSRAFPLRAHAWMLWATTAAIGLVALVTQLTADRGWLGAAAAVLTAALIAVTVLIRPRAHVRARLRGLGNILETLTMVALLPLLLGALGVYAELLGMFGGGS